MHLSGLDILKLTVGTIMRAVRRERLSSRRERSLRPASDRSVASVGRAPIFRLPHILKRKHATADLQPRHLSLISPFHVIRNFLCAMTLLHGPDSLAADKLCEYVPAFSGAAEGRSEKVAFSLRTGCPPCRSRCAPKIRRYLSKMHGFFTRHAAACALVRISTLLRLETQGLTVRSGQEETARLVLEFFTTIENSRVTKSCTQS